MSLQSIVGSIALNTTTGTQAISGLGFQPKALVLFGNKLTATGEAADSVFSQGLAISSTKRVAYSWLSRDAQATSSALEYIDNSSCYIIVKSDGTRLFSADLVSMDADGFTINVVNTDGVGYVLNYIALGGDDLSGVNLVEFTSRNSVGTQPVTGVGFQPDSVIALSSARSGSLPGSTLAMHSIGFASGPTARGAIGVRIGTTVAPQINAKTQRTNRLINLVNGGASSFDPGIVFTAADLVSMDSDGFTLNWVTANATPRFCHALCLKGGRMKVGSFSQSVTTGNQSLIGLGFQPSGLILASWNNVTSTSVISDAKLSFGAATAPTQRAAIWAGDQHSVSPEQANSSLDETKIIKMFSHGNTPTLDAAADLVSMDADGFTVNWSTTDTAAREILYFAFGSGFSSQSPSPSVSTSPSPSSSPSPSTAPVENTLSVDLVDICFKLSFAEKYPDKCGLDYTLAAVVPSSSPSASTSPSPSPSAAPTNTLLLLENGSRLLTESGDRIIL